MELSAIPIWTRGPKLAIHALEVDGRCEVEDFLLRQRETDTLLWDRLKRIFQYIGEQGTSAGGQWLRRIVAWPGQWEIKQSRHRLMGFVHRDKLILCLYRLKQGQDPDRGDLQRVARLMSEWSGTYGD